MTSASDKKQAYRDAQRAREAARRESLGLAPYEPPGKAKRSRKPAGEGRPVYGSQQWAESFRDDTGESFD